LTWSREQGAQFKWRGVAQEIFSFNFFAATQLALQLHQKGTQVVCSNKEAWKRLSESNGTPAIDLGRMNVVLK